MTDIVNVGTSANDGTGNPLRTAMQNINTEFARIATQLSLNVKNYGAVGDGTTDCLAAFNACFTAAQAGRYNVYIPPGVYNLSATPNTITVGIDVFGVGEWCTFILVDGTNQSGLSFNLNYASGGGLYNLSIHSKATNPGQTRSSGIGLSIARTNGAFRMSGIDVNGFATGIKFSSCLYTYLDDFQVLNASTAGVHFATKGAHAQDSAGIHLGTGKVSNYGTASSNTSSVGLLVEAASGLYWNSLDVTVFNEGIKFAPAASNYIAHVFCEQVLADTSVTTGWKFDSTNGSITNITATNCWGGYSTGSYGIHFTGATNALDDVKWIGGSVRENGKDGIYADFGSNLRFVGTAISQNSQSSNLGYRGASINGANFGSMYFNGCGIGNFSSSAANDQLDGIVINSGVVGTVHVVGCNFVDTGSGGSPVNNAAAGATVVLKANTPAQSGLDPVGGDTARGCSGGTIAAASTVYIGPYGSSATEAHTSVIMGYKGSITSIVAASDAAPGTGKSFIYTLRKNGVDTALTCTISNSGTVAASYGNITFTATDTLSVKVVTASGAAVTSHRWTASCSG